MKPKKHTKTDKDSLILNETAPQYDIIKKNSPSKNYNNTDIDMERAISAEELIDRLRPRIRNLFK